MHVFVDSPFVCSPTPDHLGGFSFPGFLESSSSYHLNGGALCEYAIISTFRNQQGVQVVLFFLLSTVSLNHTGFLKGMGGVLIHYWNVLMPWTLAPLFS